MSVAGSVALIASLGSRLTRLGLALVLATGTVLGLSLAGVTPAYAAEPDRIDSFTIDYDVQASGVVRVKETIDWRFGSDSGRHGIDRSLVTREKYDDTQDAVYTITNFAVSSPDDVSTAFSRTDKDADGGRTVDAVFRIGSADRTITSPTATYVISYDVSGALRNTPAANGKPAYDEFFWDGPGFGNPAMNNLAMTVEVPGGAQEVSCFAGAVGSKTPCDKSDVVDDVGVFGQNALPAKQSVSIGVKITPGLVADNTPDLQPDASQLTATQKFGAIVTAAAGALVLIGSPLVGVLWWRKNGRDQRYAGLAPGTTPLAGQTAPVVISDPDIVIPVSFSPPKIPVAEAGLLADGQVDARETAATIIDLAVRGALTVQSSGEDDFQVTLVDPSRAAAPHEMVLLTALFDGQPPGAVKDLSAQGSMLDAHTKMQASVRSQVTARGWFRKVPGSTATRSLGAGVVAVVAVLAFSVSPWVLLVVVPLLPIIVTVAVIRRKLRRGQRTAEGRAVCDQVEGFRIYLATAEAEQLKFEEGEDIFSRYLPWAIIFELADRWAKICGDLVAMGRLPDTTPYWYYGSYHMGAFNTGFLTGSLTSAATPVPAASSSGTGFGGGSSFGGGGFSGGGGGGGGSSSW